MTATPAGPQHMSRARMIGVRALLVVGVLLAVISILSTYVKREALDAGEFKQTSQELIANPAIQEQVAAQLTDALYANVDLSSELEARLPSNLQPLAGPIAGLAQGFAGTAAQNLLARPRVQDVFVGIASASQAELVKVLHGDTKALSTSDGNVVLDLRPLVLKLGDRFGFVSNLADKIPQDSAQVTLLKSSDLSTAQTVTHWLEQVANFVWILAVAAWAVRSGLPAAGAGRRFVRSGSASSSSGFSSSSPGISPASTSSTISSSATPFDRRRMMPGRSSRSRWPLPAGSRSRSAFSSRSAPGSSVPAPVPRRFEPTIAPLLKRPEIAWGSFVLGMVLIVWILPIQMFRTTRCSWSLRPRSGSSCSAVNSRRREGRRPYRRSTPPEAPPGE